MVDTNGVRRAYDEIAEEYADQRSADGPGTVVLEEFLESSDPDRLLDAGCGQGSPVLARLTDSADAVGLDVSRGQLGLAAERVPDAALVQGGMADLPFDDGAFDAIVAYWSLIHVPMADHPTVLSEFARVLRPGGRLLVCEGTDEWEGENPDWLDTGVGMAWAIAGREATEDQLRSAGFVVETSWGVPETLEDEVIEEFDADDLADLDADDQLWTFLSARLDPAT
ncbi:class I SAM-dependent methyltransferase [Saliphagus infecundisoli]|uniref:Class I SAM-dependent methyltransferase n=1 Tax=Saliphagus infecundisoli TaxID=1849069 RepID=A0ABD5QKF2_9EURY|nr:class I SAM-dependent methyltransferase [Saliphagus infecundisoli]